MFEFWESIQILNNIQQNEFGAVHQVLHNIRTLRLEKGYSQDQMARLLGTSQSAYTRFENGSTKLDYSTLEEIANILDINVEEIIYHHLRFQPKSYFDHFNRRFLKAISEASTLQEKCQQLEKLVDMLEDQLNDKNEIIRLLKSEFSR